MSVIMADNALTGESSLEDALIGSFCSIETEDEEGNAVTLNYAPYIKGNVIVTAGVKLPKNAGEKFPLLGI